MTNRPLTDVSIAGAGGYGVGPMGWDAARPVPWRRLTREWLIYAAIMVVIFLLLFRDDNPIGLIAGVLVSGPLYLLIGYVLAKFGYQRKTLKEMRTPRAEPAAAKADSGSSSTVEEKARPAPTRRTSTGPSNRPTSTKRKKKR